MKADRPPSGELSRETSSEPAGKGGGGRGGRVSWSLKGVRGGFRMRMKADRPPSGELSRETRDEFGTCRAIDGLRLKATQGTTLFA